MFRDEMSGYLFSYEGLELLFDFLEMIENDGEEQEFDPVEINGSYSEVELKYIAKNYNLTINSFEKEREELKGEPPNVEELVTNDPPKEYKYFLVISNLLVRTEDCLGQYRIITARDYGFKSDPSNRKTVYLVTDFDYKYRELALSKSEANNLGELLTIRQDDEESGLEVILDWETMNNEQLREVVQDYLERETCIVGFTKDTVVYMDF